MHAQRAPGHPIAQRRFPKQVVLSQSCAGPAVEPGSSPADCLVQNHARQHPVRFPDIADLPGNMGVVTGLPVHLVGHEPAIVVAGEAALHLGAQAADVVRVDDPVTDQVAVASESGDIIGGDIECEIDHRSAPRQCEKGRADAPAGPLLRSNWRATPPLPRRRPASAVQGSSPRLHLCAFHASRSPLA